MRKEDTLIKNATIYTVGRFLSKFFVFILLPFYTKYLTTSQYGYYDLILVTVTLVSSFVNFRLNSAVYRFVLTSKDEKEKNTIISSSFILILRNLLIFNFIYIIAVTFLIKIKFSILILIYLDLFIISSFILEVARAEKKNLVYAVSGVIETFVMLLFNIILICFTNLRVEALIISNILSYIIIISYLEYKIKIWKKIKFSYYKQELRKTLLKYSMPLILEGVNWWIIQVSDRYLIKYYLGTEANGIYAVSNKFPAIILILESMFFLAWQETAIVEYNSHNKDLFYSKIFDKLFVFLFTSCIVLISFSKILISLLVGGKFFTAYLYMPFLYIGTVFSGFSSFLSTGYRCAKKTKGLFYTSCIGAISNILLNIFLIPILGIQGASLTTMISFVTIWFIRHFHVKKYYNIKIDLKKFLVFIIMISFQVLVYFKYNNMILDRGIKIFSIVLFIIFNFSIIKNIINKVFECA